MSEQIAVLLADESFRTLANQPVQHPNAQDTNECDYLIHVEVVSHEHNHEENLKHFLLGFFD